MQFSAKVSDISKQRSACAIIAVDAKNRLGASGSALDSTCGGAIGKSSSAATSAANWPALWSFLSPKVR